ncbi:putative NADPH dehydrogenase [Spathaspora sp. JA1]|nr:putative NADPH dehydrogenase [Spathaspora sp. JA1]
MTSSKLQASNLFKPIKIGETIIRHRIAHLPASRNRAIGHVPTDLMKQYYTDRARSGGLISTEATLISLNQGIYPMVPGIFNQRQMKAWKEIVDSVHEQGAAISIELQALGRVGDAKLLKDSGLPLTGPSANYENEEKKKIAIDSGNPIQELTDSQIKDTIYVQYSNATKLAIDAGFDFIEIHGGYGYLIEQFIHPGVNQRTDKYGGNIENRARFLLELIDHLSSIIDPSKLSIRLSPLNVFQVPGANPSSESDYSYIVSQLQKRAEQGKSLGYISIVDGNFIDATMDKTKALDLGYIHKIWKGVLIRGGNYTYDYQENWSTIAQDVDDDRTLVGFCRNFVANPDLPERIKKGLSLNNCDKSTFYTPGNFGYNTYSFSGKNIEVDEEIERKRFGTALA